jgi:hypothetical protein
MPFQKLINMEKFTELRIKQLWDDLRIFAAWYASLKEGKVVVDQKTKKPLTKVEVIKRYGHGRGLLWALGYSIEGKKKPSTKSTTPEFKELFKLAIPAIKHYYKVYNGKVQKA